MNSVSRRFYLSVLILPLSVAAAEPGKQDPSPGTIHFNIGVTRRGTPMEAWIQTEDLDLHSPKTRVLLVAGMAGDRRSVDAAQQALHWFHTSPEAREARERFVLSAVPTADPDGLAGATGTRGYPPPKDGFYNSPTHPEAAYLWRWIGMHAPDVVIDVRSAAADTGEPFAPENAKLLSMLRELPSISQRMHPDELVWQLNRIAPCDTGTVPAFQIVAKNGPFLPAALAAMSKVGLLQPSPARIELQHRLDRSPLQVAEQLSRRYGHKFPEPVYIPAIAMIGRLRYGELVASDQQRTDVERIVLPYFDGSQAADTSSGSHLSGHLIFSELAARSTGAKRERYVQLAKGAADRMFEADGTAREAMPYHLEMSDSLFMGGPILAHVGALTGEGRYFDACLKHLRFMRKLCLRPDGIYRHSPLDETAWGRGNGFPALGIALCLTHFPKEHPGREELLDWFRAHLAALAPHQDRSGCWHQVIDHSESYRELTATCMIGFALARGVRNGWLDAKQYQPNIERAWYATRTRVAADGRLVDVCTGTGKQKSLREYYDRPAILGPDDRGGAMALLFATEMIAAGSSE